MTKLNNHRLLHLEKGQKHVFRKSKKYRTLCSVALGTVITTAIALGGSLVQADEVLTTESSQSTTLTENPATNLVEAQPSETPAHQIAETSTEQVSGEIPITIDHSSLDQAVTKAESQGVTVVEDAAVDLGTTQTSHETQEKLNQAAQDNQTQIDQIKQVTDNYVAAKENYVNEVTTIENANKSLVAAHQKAVQTSNLATATLNEETQKLQENYTNVQIQVSDKQVSSGDGTSIKSYQDYVTAIETVIDSNKAAIEAYVVEKRKADGTREKNAQIEAENAAGLARVEAENAAITKRNQEGQAAVDAENAAGQAAVDKRNQDNQAQSSATDAEIAAIIARNKAKEEQVARENAAIDAYNAQEKARYERELAEISKGEDGYISEALAQALNLNNGEPQAQHGATTRNPDSIIATGAAVLGGYSKILDSTGFFVYNNFSTGETLGFDYSNLQNATFNNQRITKIHYDITNLVSPSGTNSVALYVPNDPTEGFIAYRNDGTGDWRSDKMEFRVTAKYYLEDGSQVSFSSEKPGVFTHSSLNHNDIGLEYVKDSSGRFVQINGSTIQVTNEGLARSLGSNRASDIGLSQEWDTTSSPYAYKGAIVSTVTSGDSYTVTFGQGDMPANAGGISYWFALNTLPVAKTVTPYTPKQHVTATLEPVPETEPVTPETYTPKTFTPEALKTFTPQELETVVEPKLSLERVSPPVDPTLTELPSAPDVPTVHYHYHTLTTQPAIVKEVKNSDGVSIDQTQVAKASRVIYPLTVEALSPNRSQTTSLIFEDALPAGYELDLETSMSENSDYDLTYDKENHLVTLTAKPSLLESINKNRSQSYTLVSPKLYGNVQNDGATYTNSYQLLVNKGTNTAYTVNSNLVTVRTPGDGKTTSLITPTKDNRNADGVIINDTVVPLGTINHYSLTWDLNQYKGDKSSADTIAKGFFYVDDYPEEVLDVMSDGVSLTTLDGEVVTGFKAMVFSSLEEVPNDLKSKLLAAKITPQGAFQVILPEDTTAFYQNYVQTGKSLLITTKMAVKESLAGQEVRYQNKAYQIDFGNGYQTKEVSNTLVTPHPEKKDLNADGEDINHTPMAVGQVNYYQLTWDLSQYQGVKASQAAIQEGFYFIDDFDETAVTPNSDLIQLIDSQGKEVTGVSVTLYQSLSELPQSLQKILAAAGISPKGTFQVFSADNPTDFYERYVTKGLDIVITNPMTVLKSYQGQSEPYQNKGYQVDFGHVYQTQVVDNTVPVVTPSKTNKNVDGEDMAGKPVISGTINDYTMIWDLDQFKGMKASAADIAKGFYFVDDYPEDTVSVDESAVTISDSQGNAVTGVSHRIYASFEDLPEELKNLFSSEKISLTGAVQVFSADNPKDFYEQYVTKGQSLTIVSPMRTKELLTSAKESYTNKAYQIDFNQISLADVVTNTLVKPEPQKQNLNADKVSINGQAMLVGSQNFYTLTWDLDQYQGILASQDQIAKGFYFVDDYPEEALDIDGDHIQVLTRSGEAVSGITVQTYQSLEEAPESLQAALQAKQISPKGAFQVFSPKDPVTFYQNYVQTGQTLTISNPMTVKASLYNSGQSYQNKAYQVDFGLAYATEEVTNFVPEVKPTKTNTDGKELVIDGKTVLPLSVTTYDITLDYSQYKDMIVTDDVLAKGFYMVDDYPEEALSILEDGIKVVDQNGNSVTGLSVKTYDSLSDAPQVVQDAFKDRKVEPKGAIQVFSADDPKSFYETYVKTGQNLKVSIPMEVKADLAKSGGQYSNTAYQIDFGIAYVTETVLNQVPKLESEKDVVIDVSQKGQSLNGQEIALNHVFNYRLKGALIPADRASDLFEYSFKDDYDQSHDRYNGHYQVFTTVAVSLTDGTTLAEGTDVTKYTLQTLDTENGFVTIEFDSAFLSKVSAQSVFQADVYLEMERIATGQVENTFEHIVNGVTITSNTVSTYTPEVQVTVPPQEIPQSPLSETIETSKAQVLPSTGEVDNGFLALTGLGVLGLTYGLHRKRKQEGN